MTTSEALARVERAAEARSSAEEEFRAALTAARDNGYTLAQIATVAGVTRQRVHQLTESAQGSGSA